MVAFVLRGENFFKALVDESVFMKDNYSSKEPGEVVIRIYMFVYPSQQHRIVSPGVHTYNFVPDHTSDKTRTGGAQISLCSAVLPCINNKLDIFCYEGPQTQLSINLGQGRKNIHELFL